jgi:hypothetical protein
MVRLVVTALVSAGLGFSVGAWVFRSEPLAAPPAAEPRTEVQVPIVRVVERERLVEVPVPAVAPTPEAPRGAPNAPAGPPESIETLQAKVAELERQLAVEHQLRVGTEGEQITPPANLPARFRNEKQLLDTFNAALKAAGFAEAQVENIDCTEHPCIVYGRGFGAREDVDRLKPHLGAYQHDGLSTFGFANGEGANLTRFFGMAVMPDGDDRTDALHRRLNHRVQQMYEVSKPSKR